MEESSGIVSSSYIEGDRLYVMLNAIIDPDLPPLPADLCLVADGQRVSVASLDIQLDAERTFIACSLERDAPEGGELALHYTPTQWMMCVEETGDAIESFEAPLFPEPIENLDPNLRLEAPVESVDNPSVVNTKAVEVRVRSASEYRIQLSFSETLDTSVPLEVSDFRAELEDRWLNITNAKYVKSQVDDVLEIRLELSEPMESGRKVKVDYRSPTNRLKTIHSEPVAAFSVAARVDRIGRDTLHEDAELESVAVTKAEEVVEEASVEDITPVEPATGASELDALAHQDEAATDVISEEATDDDFEEDVIEPEAQDELVDELPVDDIVAPVAEEEPPTESAELEEHGEEEGIDPLLDLEDDWDARELVDDTREMVALSEDLEADIPPEEEDEPEEFESTEIETDGDAIGSNDELPSEDIASAEAPVDSEESLPVKDSEASILALMSEGSGAPKVNSEEQTREQLIAEKAARIQKALEAKSERELPPGKAPLTLTAKIIYGIPIVVFAWLLIVVCIYVIKLTFDINLGGEPEEVVPEFATEMARRLPNETCSMKSADGSRYEGQCLRGERDGVGVYEWASGNRYEGEWRQGKRHGQGKLTYASGAVYEGQYRNGLEHGAGRMSWPNGAFYEGQYADGRFHGKGVYVSADGSRYEGVFENGSMTQQGECIAAGGQRTPGPCQQGQ